MKIRNELEDLLTKPLVYIFWVRPKKHFNHYPVLSQRPRKEAHSPINTSSIDIDKFEEKNAEEETICQKCGLWLVN